MKLGALANAFSSLGRVGWLFAARAVASNSHDLLLLEARVPILLRRPSLIAGWVGAGLADGTDLAAGGVGLCGCGLSVHLLELGDVDIDLVNGDGAGALFVEHAEHRLVLLLVDRKLLLVGADHVCELGALEESRGLH